MIPSAVCILVVAIHNKFSLSSKFLRNLGSTQKTSTHASSHSRKHTTGFLVKSFGECCKSTILTATCYWPTSHCIPAQKFMSVSGEVNHDLSPWVLDSDKGVCCHHSFSQSVDQWFLTVVLPFLPQIVVLCFKPP